MTSAAEASLTRAGRLDSAKVSSRWVPSSASGSPAAMK